MALEMPTWFSISVKKDGDKQIDYIKDQIHKRWHAFNANINCATGLAIAGLIQYFNKIEFPNIYWEGKWWMAVMISIFIFLKVGWYAYKDVKIIDKIMVARYIEN